MSPGDLSTLVLCGGKGTRAYPLSLEMPKPLLDVSGRPILRHVMDIYAGQGVRKFILAAGYKIDAIRTFASSLPDEWSVEVVNTGEDTNTGARVLRCRDRLTGRFFATYGDGLANVDLSALLRFHESSQGTATITTVPLPSQYGTVDIDEAGLVLRFTEKPRLFDHWINGGFFVMEPTIFDRWPGDDLEKDVLPALAARGELIAYRHFGFWKSMDTYKDAMELSELATSEIPPWFERPSVSR